ncbi:hypothetical protein CCH79_00018903 [Gambusia affinis]|uniref:ZP domain-containing protein n=1 Tax=Gambusia affinis TaxID=33528 RepID=A0A315VIJ5_GAMAF|nr:hypothetical protein CCH79_00018903 [Gambusia affinis]
MASAVFLLLQLLLLTSQVSASHHWGGTTSFTYKGRNPDGTVKMSLRTRDTYDSCNNYHYWYCYGGNCGYANTRVRSQIDSSSNTPSYESQWCESETVETWTLPSDKPFNLRAASCCWIDTRNSVVNWNYDSQVDFGTRSDTRKPNKSPDIAIVPFLRVPQNCPRTYRLAAFDPDGDRVRCRYGSNPGYECDNCHLPSGFQLDQDSCTLRYQSTYSDYRIFGFEMVVEDYARGTIDLFYSDGSMDPPVPSCEEGLYLPKFESPTPSHGTQITAEVNKEVEIRVKATAVYSSIQNIVFSGPTNVTKHRDTNNDFVIRWTPAEDDLEEQYPICFVVESVNGNSAYQSEMRCVLVEVQKHQNNRFGAMFSPNSYPLEYNVGDRIYMQLDASSSVNNTEMFVESCRAAPYDNPNYHPTYSIIENGCNVDPTLQIHSTANNKEFRFSIEAFKFIGLHDQVYISCTVMMCEAGNPNTRCSRGCSNSTWHNVRRKREAVIESGKHFVSQGPLRLKREADPRGGSAVNLNLNMMFVAGCLLAAVGMICGVIIYKTKTSRAKYQPLPTHES